METLVTPEFLSALAAIVVIDLVLAGDNAIVIALAARNLPQRLKSRAIVWGTLGALDVPGLMLAGGMMLVWIAFRLLTDQVGGGHAIAPAASFWGAMQTIVVADA